MEFLFKVIVADNRAKNDIGLYTLVCPASEGKFEKQKMLNFLQRKW
jgi:hypothetical protein